MSPDHDDRTPTFAEVIRKGARYELGAVHTIVITTVQSYNREENTADVKPVINESFGDQTQEFPVIPRVPVHFPEWGPFTIRAPLQEGQEVLLLINERSMDEWLLEGRTNVDPSDKRRFNLSDGVILAGIRPFPDALVPREGEMTIGSSSLEIRLSEDGSFAVEDGEGNELMDLIGNFLDETESLRSQTESIASNIASSTVATASGPQPLLPASGNMAAIITQLQEISTQLSSIEQSLNSLSE